MFSCIIIMNIYMQAYVFKCINYMLGLNKTIKHGVTMLTPCLLHVYYHSITVILKQYLQ